LQLARGEPSYPLQPDENPINFLINKKISFKIPIWLLYQAKKLMYKHLAPSLTYFWWVLPKTKHLKYSDFILRVKNKLLSKIKRRCYLACGGGVSLAWPNPMRKSLSLFPYWLLTYIKVHYINTRIKFYFFNAGLKAH